MDHDKLIDDLEAGFARRMGEIIAELVIQGNPDKAERLALTATRMISDIAAFGIDETYFTEMRYWEPRSDYEIAV
jgi:hypothetical protein